MFPNKKARWSQTIHQHMRNQKSLYIFVAVLFMMGVVFGTVIVNMLDPNQKSGLLNYLGYFFRQLHEDQIAEPFVAFQHATGDHLKTIGLLWILGLSVIGIPIILILIFIKGLVIGFTVGFLVNQLSWDGLWFACVSIVPQNLFVVPTFIIVAVTGISFSLLLIRNRLIHHRGAIYPSFVSFSLLAMGMGILLIVAGGFEAYISPWLMKKVLPHTSWISSMIHLSLK
ncbi:stage II sporulation protein M [Thermoflavimicrobium dichotomicum]|uniref:Stage II sporulation protein M n=1 Tax=Thermoflavimicrobium dichotomicum TaxID=46223 RepID=A0A1I3Q6M2_9BACL|nr:stage II sporulation protein M [Thermoflavimicrobium dichotomicum]SFJ29057.1 stage II sporulation protein M [Thermoflavimicrobium dichotomicum]